LELVEQANYNINPELIIRSKLYSYYCPKTLDASFIGGRYYDNTYNQTTINLLACNNATSSNCQTYDAIAEQAAKLKFRMFYLTVNFDGSSNNQTLSGYVDTT
jgi:hypothetical protein